MYVMDDIFREQDKLQNAYAKVQGLPGGPGDNPHIDGEQALEMLKCASEECYEAIMTMKHRKKWSGIKPMQGLHAAKQMGLLEEIVDAQLFLIAALQWSGYTYAEFVAACEAKQKTNWQRIQTLADVKLTEDQKADADARLKAEWAYSDLPWYRKLLTNKEAYINANSDSR